MFSPVTTKRWVTLSSLTKAFSGVDSGLARGGKSGCEFSKNSLFKGIAGYSLVEVVLAVGVFAGGILLIYGLLPGLLNESRESWQDTRAAHITRQIVSDLRGSENLPPVLVTSGGFTDSQLVTEPVDTTVAGTYQLAYTAEGQAVPLGDPKAVLVADLKITPAAGRSRISDLAIEIRPRDIPAGSGFRFNHSCLQPGIQEGAMNRTTRAFTLLKLMVACATTMLLGVVMLALFMRVMDSWRNDTDRTEAYREARA